MSQKKMNPPGPSLDEEEHIFIGDYIMRNQFYMKENNERLVLMDSKIGVMTEIMMSLKDILQSYIEIDRQNEKPPNSN